MSNTTQQLESIVDEIKNRFSMLSKFYIEIGVFTGKTRRKVKVGVTNAELMFIHENGSPLKNIPARPVLQMTIDYANSNLLPQTLKKCMDMILQSNVDEAAIEKEFSKLAIKLENYARELIYSNDGRLAPNAPGTIARKGDNHPLFDTGQLARSITCRVAKS